VIAGLSLGTQPAQLLRAAMEAITYQLVAVATTMRRVVPRPESVVATGGQLIHSPGWSQMLADALNLRVTTSPQPEASSRGAALLVLHALGRVPKLWSTTPGRGRSFRPRPTIHARYERARRRQQRLYELLFPPIAVAVSDSRTKDLRSPAAKH
jgi:sugar (pentulose or hexulose) kinase